MSRTHLHVVGSTETVELQGVITSAAFASGDRLVIGAWQRGPLGPMNDVMWCQPSGRRVLLAPNARVGDFVNSLYNFDEVQIDPTLDVTASKRSFTLTGERVSAQLMGGRSVPIPFGAWRTPWFTRHIEGAIARRLLNVTTYGQAKGGVQEWYRADSYIRLVSGSATIDGARTDLVGSMGRAMGFGFSEPPSAPSMVRVRPLLLDTSGRLASRLASLR